MIELKLAKTTRRKGQANEAIEFKVQRSRKEGGAQHICYLCRIQTRHLQDPRRLDALKLDVFRRAEDKGLDAHDWWERIESSLT